MTVAIVGASETTELGRIPDLSQLQLHADAALNTMADAKIKPSDIDGVATAGASPTEIAHYLGIAPRWADGTSVGGCSFMLHVRHAVAAIEAGHCTTVLITHGESGRSGVGRGGFFGGGGGASSSLRLAKRRRTNQAVTPATTRAAAATNSHNTHSLPVGMSITSFSPRMSGISSVAAAFVATAGSGITRAAELVLVVGGIRQQGVGVSGASQKIARAP